MHTQVHSSPRLIGNPSASSPLVSVIVPTIGRPESLRRMLRSLVDQTFKNIEVVVADGSSNLETDLLVSETCWSDNLLSVVRISVSPPNAVAQRRAAIATARGEFLLLLDDDVVLEPDCVGQMIQVLHNDLNIVGVFADFNNQSWSLPTKAWRFYLRYVLRLSEGEWQGKVVGPLLRFGYNPVPSEPRPIEWLGAGNTMIRRAAYDQAGGFSEFFLHRCTSHEDVDLGLKLARVGRILFCPAVRMAHHQAPGGRVSIAVAAEDDIHNRFLVLRRTVGKSAARAFGQVGLFVFIETTSNFLGCLKRGSFTGFAPRLFGRVRGAIRVAFFKTGARTAESAAISSALKAQ
jgi:GT2 family glycosyltransferase